MHPQSFVVWVFASGIEEFFTLDEALGCGEWVSRKFGDAWLWKSSGLVGIIISPVNSALHLSKPFTSSGLKNVGSLRRKRDCRRLEAELELPAQCSVSPRWALAWSSGVERYAAGVVAGVRPEET